MDTSLGACQLNHERANNS